MSVCVRIVPEVKHVNGQKARSASFAGQKRINGNKRFLVYVEVCKKWG